MTEREQLRAEARAAGLRLSRRDLDRLLPAWRRYQDLVRAMRKQVSQDPGVDSR